MIAAPFAAGALFLKPPYAFISLIPSNVIGEMWIGVTLTVVVELVPNTIRSPAIAGYLFIISIIGGNMPLLVPPLKRLTSLRTALYILFPGLYLLSSVLFLFTVFSLKWDLRRAQEEEDEIRPYPRVLLLNVKGNRETAGVYLYINLYYSKGFRFVLW